MHLERVRCDRWPAGRLLIGAWRGTERMTRTLSQPRDLLAPSHLSMIHEPLEFLW